MPRGTKVQAMLDSAVRCLERVSEHRRGKNIQRGIVNAALHCALSCRPEARQQVCNNSAGIFRKSALLTIQSVAALYL